MKKWEKPPVVHITHFTTSSSASSEWAKCSLNIHPLSMCVPSRLSPKRVSGCRKRCGKGRSWKPRAPAAQEQGQQTCSEPGYVQNAPGGTSASRPATDGHLVRLRDRTSRFSDGRVSRWECPSQIKASPLFC